MEWVTQSGTGTSTSRMKAGISLRLRYGLVARSCTITIMPIPTPRNSRQSGMNSTSAGCICDSFPFSGRLAQAADDADQSLWAQRNGPTGAVLPDEEHERLLLQDRRFLRHRYQQKRNDQSLMENPTRALALVLLFAGFGCKTAS